MSGLVTLAETDLGTIEDLIIGGGDGHPIRGRHLLRVVRQLRQMFGQTDDRLDTIEQRARDFAQQADGRLDTLEADVPVLDGRLDTLETNVPLLGSRLTTDEAQMTTLAGRVTTLENVAVLTLNVVATPAGLPASANPRQWFRVQGDPAVYIGNGAGQPLTKLVPA
jgi:hypothetical protein